MFLYPSSKKRPFHLGPFPQEVLPRAPVDTIAVASTLTAGPSPAPSIANSPLARVAQHYGELFAASLRGVAAPGSPSCWGGVAATGLAPASVHREAQGFFYVLAV